MSRVITLLGQFIAGLLVMASSVQAGTVSSYFDKGAFGIAWGDTQATLEARYPKGAWQEDSYCVDSQQSIMKLPALHQTQKLCFSLGADKTVNGIFAHFNPSLPSLLAVVNRVRTLFGDFDSVRRDENAIQSRDTALLWTRDSPLQLRVLSQNDDNGRPVLIVLAILENADPLPGVKQVNNQPRAA